MQHRGSKNRKFSKKSKLNENRGKFINFAEVGECINFVEIGGIYNMHHLLRRMDAPGCINIKTYILEIIALLSLKSCGRRVYFLCDIVLHGYDGLLYTAHLLSRVGLLPQTPFAHP